MLRGSSDSEGSECEGGQGSGVEEQSENQGRRRVVLRAPTLRVGTVPTVEGVQAELEQQEARLRAAAAEQARAMEAATNLEWVRLQAVTSLDLRKDISSIERFSGDEGELNHFIRSGDGVSQMILERQQAGRLDGVGAASLQRALVRRVHRNILNLLQADETTPWEEVRRRLQKCYGGGRWTPDEDALRLFRLTRGRLTKGEFAAQLLRQYSAVVDRYREALPAGEAATKIALVEAMVRVQLGEATGEAVTRPVVEEANKIIDAAEREESVRPHREWRAPRPEGPKPEWRRRPTGYREERRRPEGVRERRTPAARPSPRSRTEQRCYKCGKMGHIQAKCPMTKCFECQAPGHLARNCPYIRAPRPPRGEPMEVNAQRPVARRSRTEDGASSGLSVSDRDTDDNSATTESEDDARSYATVVRRGKKGNRRGGGGPGARE